MRWILGSLILANVLLFAWHFFVGKEPVSGAVQVGREQQSAVADKSSIKLLSEVQAFGSDDTAESNSPEISSASEVANTSTSSAVEDEESPLELSAAPSVDDEGNPLCTLVGPFPKLLRAEYFIERLAALDVSSSVYEIEIPGDVGYWVFLAPEESRKQAYNKLRELQAKGVDSYVIPKGELENGISFGMFSRQNLAEQRLQAMKEQGYPAELKEISRSYKEIWVLLASGQAKLLGDKVWLEMLSNDEGIERRQNYCPAVASE